MEFPAAHRDSEGFSELAPLTCCLPLVKGQLGVGPSGIAPQAESWAAPRPVQITQEQRGQALPCLCSSIPAADCWNICQRVLRLLPEGCCVQLFVFFFYLTLQNFAFYHPVWRMEPGTRSCWLGLATDPLARVPGASRQCSRAGTGGRDGRARGCLFKAETRTLWLPLCGV